MFIVLETIAAAHPVRVIWSFASLGPCSSGARRGVARRCTNIALLWSASTAARGSIDIALLWSA
jgi:hypothetical protein